MTDTKSDLIIVVGVDFSETGDLALLDAVRRTREHPNAELHCVHVITKADVADAPGSDRIEQQSAALAGLPERMWKHIANIGLGIETGRAAAYVSVHVRMGPPAEAIQQVAVDYDADLIIMGTHGRRGLEKLIIGSCVNKLLPIARCPVLVVRPKDYVGLQRSERPEPPRDSPSLPGEPLETHIYTSGDRLSWEVPTGVRLL